MAAGRSAPASMSALRHPTRPGSGARPHRSARPSGWPRSRVRVAGEVGEHVPARPALAQRSAATTSVSDHWATPDQLQQIGGGERGQVQLGEEVGFGHSLIVPGVADASDRDGLRDGDVPAGPLVPQPVDGQHDQRDPHQQKPTSSDGRQRFVPDADADARTAAPAPGTAAARAMDSGSRRVPAANSSSGIDGDDAGRREQHRRAPRACRTPDRPATPITTIRRSAPGRTARRSRRPANRRAATSTCFLQNPYMPKENARMSAIHGGRP